MRFWLGYGQSLHQHPACALSSVAQQGVHLLHRAALMQIPPASLGYKAWLSLETSFCKELNSRWWLALAWAVNQERTCPSCPCPWTSLLSLCLRLHLVAEALRKGFVTDHHHHPWRWGCGFVPTSWSCTRKAESWSQHVGTDHHPWEMGLWVVVGGWGHAAGVFSVFAMPDFYSTGEGCQCGENTSMVSDLWALPALHIYKNFFQHSL